MKTYTFYRNGQEYKTSNLAEFCRDNHLQRRHIYEVIEKKRIRYKGFALSPENAPVDDGSIALSDLLKTAKATAEIMTEAGDTSRDWEEVIRRTDLVNQGKPLVVPAKEYDQLMKTNPDEMEELLSQHLVSRA